MKGMKGMILMNKEKIKIEPIENGFKASIEIPKAVIDLELNEYLNRIDEINRLIITDKNELYTRELLNRIDNAMGYIKYCQTSDKDIFPVIEAEKMIEILKGGSNE